MNISKIKGMKYPDEQFIKYFFKNGFTSKKDIKFIEFGCSNGNNLMLPFQYGYEVVGIDLDKNSILNAEENFNNISDNIVSSYSFHIDDMRNFAKNNKNLDMDVFLLPNVVNYIKKDELIEFFHTMVENNNIKKDADFFIRCRTPKDFRFAIGEKVEHNTYVMPENFTITGEPSCLNRFYTESELVLMLEKHLNLKNYNIFYSESQNLQEDNTLVFDADIILWGKIN